MLLYWVVNPANNQVWTYNSTGTPTVSQNDPTSFTYNVGIFAFAPAAPAFEIYATIQNVYVPYSNSLGVTWSNPLQINYFSVPPRSPTGDFTVLSSGDGLINLDPSVVNYPDVLGHEFGHFVAYEGGFMQPLQAPITSTNRGTTIGSSTHWLRCQRVASTICGDCHSTTNLWLSKRGLPTGTPSPAKLGTSKQTRARRTVRRCCWQRRCPTYSTTARRSTTPKTLSTSTTTDPRIPRRRGEDDEGSVARILWGLTKNSDQTYAAPTRWTDAQLFQAIVAAFGPTPPAPPYALPAPNPTPATLNNFTRYLALFYTAQVANSYAPLYEGYNVSPYPVSINYISQNGGQLASNSICLW